MPLAALGEEPKGRLGGSDESVHVCDQRERRLFLWALELDFLHPDGTRTAPCGEGVGAADLRCGDTVSRMSPRRIVVSIDEPREYQVFRERGAVVAPPTTMSYT